MNSMPRLLDPNLPRWAELAIGLCVAALFVMLRLPDVGHLLVWDEAMNLCSTRSFIDGGRDVFSDWFWRHPPLYALLMSLMSPLQSGFAERVECLNIAIGLINGGLLYILCKRVFGKYVALFAIFLWALQPGSVFFDLWIKRDHLTVSFCLGSLILCQKGKVPLAGLLFGLALLTKETAAFYAPVLAIVTWSNPGEGKRPWVSLGLFFGLAALISAGWHLYLGGGIGEDGSLLDHLSFARAENSLWAGTWFYYLNRIPLYAGVAGTGLAVLGILALVSKRALFQFWPLLTLLPALFFLSLISSKVVWIVIVLFPALVVLQALGLEYLLRFGLRFGKKFGAALMILSVLIVGIFQGAETTKHSYEERLKSFAEGQWRGAARSYEIAMGVNERVGKEEGLLFTSFWYWQDIPPGSACAIFTYYLRPDIPVLVRSHGAPPESLFQDLEKYGAVRWMLLSPEPGATATKTFEAFNARCGKAVAEYEGAFLYQRPTP